MLANQRIEPSRLRRSAVVQGGPFTSLFVEPVHPARQHMNLRTVVEGPPIVVSAAHAKIRRDGYRRSRGQ
jgi:hypothetical protein